jgi:hypothetical protein
MRTALPEQIAGQEVLIGKTDRRRMFVVEQRAGKVPGDLMSGVLEQLVDLLIHGA